MGYSIPPSSDGVTATEYDGQGYGPNRALYCSSDFTILAMRECGSSLTPACTATVTCTGRGRFAVAVAVASAKRPADVPMSPTDGADQGPCPSATPVASTSYPAGTVT